MRPSLSDTRGPGLFRGADALRRLPRKAAKIRPSLAESLAAFAGQLATRSAARGAPRACRCRYSRACRSHRHFADNRVLFRDYY